MKTIIFGRHAKSSWDDYNIGDHDRTLNKRGFKDAKIMGKKLMELGYVPDLIITSSAKRAKLTAEIYAKYLINSEFSIDKELYLAPSHLFIKKANELDDKYKTVLMIAHNPGITQLANEFSVDFIGNIPTSGIFKVDFDIKKWKEINTFNGVMDLIIFPKMYKK